MRDTLMTTLSLAHDLFNIMPNYLDAVWPWEMMQTMMYVDAKMLSNDIDSDDDACELIYMIMDSLCGYDDAT